MLKNFIAKILGIEETYPSATKEIYNFAKANYAKSKNNYPEITIIMPSLDRMKVIKRCVDSLYSNTSVNFKLIIVDNGSKTETINLLKKIARTKDNVEVIYLSENSGAAHVRQLALEKVTTELVAFLDNDIMIMPGYFENLIEKIREEEILGGVQSKVIFPNKLIQINHPVFEIKDGWIYYNDLDINKSYKDPSTFQAQYCDWIPIGATLWRKKIFDEFKFNEQMKTSYEDNELALRISKAGYKFSNCPSSLCIHFHTTFTPSSLKDSKYLDGRYNLGTVRNSAKIFYKINNLIYCYGDKEQYIKEYLQFKDEDEYKKFLNT